MKSTSLFPIAIIAFFINPLITIVIMASLVIKNKSLGWTKSSRNYLLLFGTFCCFFVSLINMKKVPESDLEWYVDRYSYASHMSFIDFVLIASSATIKESLKEPLFGVIVWMLNRCFGGNVNLFKLSISLMEYSLLVTAIICFGRLFRMKLYLILTGILMICFIPYIFTMSLHLVRQFLATSILFYAIIKKCFYGKNEWWAMLSMLLIHSTTALFIPVLLLPAFDKPLKKAKIWYLGAFLAMITIKYIAGFLYDVGGFYEDSTIGYVLNRAQQNTTFASETLSVSKILIFIFVLAYSIYIFFSKYAERVLGLRRFSFIFIFLSVFVLVNLNQTQLALRFSYYIFIVIPFFLMFFFKNLNTSNIFLFGVGFCMIVFFSSYLYIGTWTYDIDVGGWVTPVFSYFM